MVELVELQLALDRFLTAQPYYPCCLLVHPEVVRLQQIKEQLKQQYAWPVLPLGSVVSAQLLPMAKARRSSATYGIVTGALRSHTSAPVICADIDLLFEPSLMLDPLRLVRDASRVAPVIVLWPGRFAHDVLTYAEPAHAHYRAWPHPDLCPTCIIPL